MAERIDSDAWHASIEKIGITLEAEKPEFCQKVRWEIAEANQGAFDLLYGERLFPKKRKRKPRPHRLGRRSTYLESFFTEPIVVRTPHRPLGGRMVTPGPPHDQLSWQHGTCKGCSCPLNEANPDCQQCFYRHRARHRKAAVDAQALQALDSRHFA